MVCGLWIDFELRKSVTTLSTKPEVVCSRRGRHLEIVYDVITPPRADRFGRSLVTRFRIARTWLRSGQNRKGKNCNRQIEHRYCDQFLNAFVDALILQQIKMMMMMMMVDTIYIWRATFWFVDTQTDRQIHTQTDRRTYRQTDTLKTVTTFVITAGNNTNCTLLYYWCCYY